MLSTSDVAYRLKTGRALFADVNLHLELGDAIAVVGPSGTGKSTLLAILGGLLAPTRGRVIGPKDPAAYSWILQGLNGLPARRVIDNVRVCALLDRDDARIGDARAGQALEGLGIESLARSRLADLSGGELQRVGIARALTATRPIILADEPTSQLDCTTARTAMGMLVDAAQDRAVVIVTHDLDALPDGVAIARLTSEGLTCVRR